MRYVNVTKCISGNGTCVSLFPQMINFDINRPIDKVILGSIALSEHCRCRSMALN